MDETLDTLFQAMRATGRRAQYLSEGIRPLNLFKIAARRQRMVNTRDHVKRLPLEPTAQSTQQLDSDEEPHNLLHAGLVISGILLVLFSIFGFATSSLPIGRRQRRWQEWEDSEQAEHMLPLLPVVDDQV